MGAAENATGGSGSPVLRFFGMETAARASETVTWVAPYVGMFLFGLVLMSLLVQRLFPLPLWVHVLAIGVAGVNCFLFLARIRKSSLEDPEDGDRGGEAPIDPEEG